ncbi:hypothetical protein SMBr_34700 [Shewanella sp. M-Br]|nr:hypothetical protein SMBr_34700 [Shewanella sp. M-Br]
MNPEEKIGMKTLASSNSVPNSHPRKPIGTNLIKKKYVTGKRDNE